MTLSNAFAELTSPNCSTRNLGWAAAAERTVASVASTVLVVKASFAAPRTSNATSAEW